MRLSKSHKWFGGHVLLFDFRQRIVSEMTSAMVRPLHLRNSPQRTQCTLLLTVDASTPERR